MKKAHLISICLSLSFFFVTGCEMLVNPNGSADISRGWRQYRRGNYKNAISDFNVALRENPQSAEAYLGLAITWEDMGDYGKAVEYFSKAVEIEPRFRFSHYDIGSNKVESVDIRRGWREFGRGSYDQAITSFNLALKKSPQSAEAYSGLAWIWWYKKDYEKAMENVSKAIELEPRAKQKAGYFFMRATIESQDLKDCERAIVDYASAISIDPNFLAVYVDRAYCYRKIGKLQAALADYDKALELAPKDTPAYEKAFGGRKDLLVKTGNLNETK